MISITLLEVIEYLYENLSRDGQLQITGGRGSKNYARTMFLRHTCLQDCCFRPLHESFLGITVCRIYLDKFLLQKFFWSKVAPPLSPPATSNGL